MVLDVVVVVEVAGGLLRLYQPPLVELYMLIVSVLRPQVERLEPVAPPVVLQPLV